MASGNKRRRSDVTSQSSISVRNKDNVSDEDLRSTAIQQLAILRKDGGFQTFQKLAVIGSTVSEEDCQPSDSVVGKFNQESDAQLSVERNGEGVAFQQINGRDSWHCLLKVPLTSPAIQLTTAHVCLLEAPVQNSVLHDDSQNATGDRVGDIVERTTEECQPSDIGIQLHTRESQKGHYQRRDTVVGKVVWSQTNEDGTLKSDDGATNAIHKRTHVNGFAQDQSYQGCDRVIQVYSIRSEDSHLSEPKVSCVHSKNCEGGPDLSYPGASQDFHCLSNKSCKKCRNLCECNIGDGSLQVTDKDIRRKVHTEGISSDRRDLASPSGRKEELCSENGLYRGTDINENVQSQEVLDGVSDSRHSTIKLITIPVHDVGSFKLNTSSVHDIESIKLNESPVHEVGSASRMVPVAGAEVVTWAGLAAALGESPHQWPFLSHNPIVTSVTESVPSRSSIQSVLSIPSIPSIPSASSISPIPSVPSVPSVRLETATPTKPLLTAGTFPSYPPPAAFLSPKCALWDCLRPAQGDYCSELHAAMAATEGGNGRAPVVRPWGIELKDPLLLAALRARISGKAVGIPDCEKAATAKSPWGAPELFDINMLVGEPLREWLFFDKSQPAYGTGTRKQRALPDYSGRWHDSYKQHFKDHGGLKRILYLDPQPTGNVEWHLYEYELKGSSEWALYRLEMKKRDPTKAVNSVLIQSSQRGGHKSAFTVVKPRSL